MSPLLLPPLLLLLLLLLLPATSGVLRLTKCPGSDLTLTVPDTMGAGRRLLAWDSSQLRLVSERDRYASSRDRALGASWPLAGRDPLASFFYLADDKDVFVVDEAGGRATLRRPLPPLGATLLRGRHRLRCRHLRRGVGDVKEEEEEGDAGGFFRLHLRLRRGRLRLGLGDDADQRLRLALSSRPGQTLATVAAFADGRRRVRPSRCRLWEPPNRRRLLRLQGRRLLTAENWPRFVESKAAASLSSSWPTTLECRWSGRLWRQRLTVEPFRLWRRGRRRATTSEFVVSVGADSRRLRLAAGVSVDIRPLLMLPTPPSTPSTFDDGPLTVRLLRRRPSSVRAELRRLPPYPASFASSSSSSLSSSSSSSSLHLLAEAADASFELEARRGQRREVATVRLRLLTAADADSDDDEGGGGGQSAKPATLGSRTLQLLSLPMLLAMLAMLLLLLLAMLLQLLLPSRCRRRRQSHGKAKPVFV